MRMLKVSLAACITHKGCQYHVNLYISFRLHVNGKYLLLVNDATVKTAIYQSMGQLGSTLKRLVSLMSDKFNLGFTFLFSKLNIVNGFLCLVVSHLQGWYFCYVLPVANGRPVSLSESELVVPTTLLMGLC